jgi:hypothetical protein
MNKTDRKNKTNQNINWPSHGSLFTIKELLEQHNPDFKEITLRVRIDKAIKKDKLVSVIGYKNVGKGRPTMMLTMNPVSQDLLDKAYADGIQPPEVKPLVTVMDVTATTTSVVEPSTASIIDIPINDSVSLGDNITA